MNKNNKNILDDNEIMVIMVGFMVGTGILSLPNALAKDAKQDAWISAFIGALYPLGVSLASVYFCKYYPDDNILVLSKKYLGKILGTICNLLLLVFYAIYLVSTITGFTQIFRVYATPFLSPLKIQLVVMIMVMYTWSKGLKVLAKMNELSFYIVCILMALIGVSLFKGRILNVQPVFGSGVKNIFKASIESAYSYGAVEQILLIYPFMKNKNKLKSAVLKGTLITAFFYTWVTFITIYYLGYKFTTINLWPVFLVTESISIPLINSFRSMYLLGWTGIMCIVLSNEYNSIMTILKDILNMKSIKLIYVFALPIFLYLFTKLPNPMYRAAFNSKAIPIMTIYSLSYIGLIALLMFFDKKKIKKM